MNIKQAKEFIKDTVTMYLKKDKYGEYVIPVVRQRPIFLVGAPGVGKTAIMEQIAAELGIAIVSYSMTHHTRQSALGLPYIVEKTYDNQSVQITEYTMSEIIASIYDVMESSNIKEGILFLDEINCVSETLAPSMLQFLQYKVFGRHAVPEGWVIVTAGNPPEYNRSVREFDIVTLDRLKLMEVEAEYGVWKEYAIDKRLHGAVVNYLEINKDDFYVIDTTVKGRGYVTARGWEDLSQILTLYEEEKLPVDEMLVGQYLRNSRIVREFSAYYDLYCRYVADYHIDDILAGRILEQSVEKARQADFNERLSVIGIFTDRLLGSIKDVMHESAIISELFPMLKALKDTDDVPARISKIKVAKINALDSKSKAGALSTYEKAKEKAIIAFLTNTEAKILQESTDNSTAFDIARQEFNTAKGLLKEHVDNTSVMLDNVLEFALKAFGENNELILLLTELTVDKDSTAFLSTFGNQKYLELSQKLMIDDPNDKLLKQIENLDL